MCGRINVLDDPLTKAVSEQLGILFQPETNHDLKPTEYVSSVIQYEGELSQVNLQWGIKPKWAKRIIINAQAESVYQKPTFKEAFEQHRVIIPCSGWYEWVSENGRKEKYLFSSACASAVYMAGIALDGHKNLVTLTTEPNDQCQAFHHRMPLLIAPHNIRLWLGSDVSGAIDLLRMEWEDGLIIERG